MTTTNKAGTVKATTTVTTKVVPVKKHHVRHHAKHHMTTHHHAKAIAKQAKAEGKSTATEMKEHHAAMAKKSTKSSMPAKTKAATSGSTSK